MGPNHGKAADARRAIDGYLIHPLDALRDPQSPGPGRVHSCKARRSGCSDLPQRPSHQVYNGKVRESVDSDPGCSRRRAPDIDPTWLS